MTNGPPAQQHGLTAQQHLALEEWKMAADWLKEVEKAAWQIFSFFMVFTGLMTTSLIVAISSVETLQQKKYILYAVAIIVILILFIFAAIDQKLLKVHSDRKALLLHRETKILIGNVPHLYFFTQDSTITTHYFIVGDTPIYKYRQYIYIIIIVSWIGLILVTFFGW